MCPRRSAATHIGGRQQNLASQLQDPAKPVRVGWPAASVESFDSARNAVPANFTQAPAPTDHRSDHAISLSPRKFWRSRTIPSSGALFRANLSGFAPTITSLQWFSSGPTVALFLNRRNQDAA